MSLRKSDKFRQRGTVISDGEDLAVAGAVVKDGAPSVKICVGYEENVVT